MVHQAEINFRLDLVKKSISDILFSDSLEEYDVILIRLPNISNYVDYQLFDPRKFEKTLIYNIWRNS